MFQTLAIVLTYRRIRSKYFFLLICFSTNSYFYLHVHFKFNSINTSFPENYVFLPYFMVWVVAQTVMPWVLWVWFKTFKSEFWALEHPGIRMEKQEDVSWIKELRGALFSRCKDVQSRYLAPLLWWTVFKGTYNTGRVIKIKIKAKLKSKHSYSPR